MTNQHFVSDYKKLISGKRGYYVVISAVCQSVPLGHYLLLHY